MQKIEFNWINFKYFESFFNDSKTFIKINQGIFSELKDHFYVSDFEVRLEYSDDKAEHLHSHRWIKNDVIKHYSLKRYTITYMHEECENDKEKHVYNLLHFFSCYNIKIKEAYFKVACTDGIYTEFIRYFRSPVSVEIFTNRSNKLFLSIPVDEKLFDEILKVDFNGNLLFDDTKNLLYINILSVQEITV